MLQYVKIIKDLSMKVMALLLCLIFCFPLLPQDYLELGIKEFHYNKQQGDSEGVATLLANSFKIDIDQFNFSIDESNELFEGTLIYDKQFVHINSSFLNIQIDVGPQEDIWKISNLDLSNGEFIYNYPKTRIGGEKLFITIDGLDLRIANSNIDCVSQENFVERKDIDIDGIIRDCLNHSTIKALGSSSNASTDINFYKDNKSPFSLKSEIKSVSFEKENFYINSPSIRYEGKNNKVQFKNVIEFFSKCFA